MRVNVRRIFLLLLALALLEIGSPAELISGDLPASSSSKGSVAKADPASSQASSYRIDFGVTPDDFGNVPNCESPQSVSTQYLLTQSIVFGTAVDFLGGPTPGVYTVTDPGCTPGGCRSAGGYPLFQTDW